ncbi:MAG: alpha-L-arabinofuranosidase [Fimbriimonadales bacterium]
MQRWRCSRSWVWATVLCLSLIGGYADEHLYPAVYRDYPAGRWDDWSWANRDMANTNPVRSGQRSIRADLFPWSAVRFHYQEGFDPTGFTHLEFWVHGGTQGGQRFSVMVAINGVNRAPVPVTNYVSAIPANQWVQVQIPLTALGVSSGDRISDLYFIDRRGVTEPTFYLDDIRFTRPVPSTTVSVQVNASQTLTTMTALKRGINVACWDWFLTQPQRVSLMKGAGFGVLRFPGGSTSNEYDWRTNRNRRTGGSYGTDTQGFLNVANSIGAEKIICVNYGSGTPAEARDWVQYANITLNGNVRYWTIGNENYGTWEHDTHPNRHDAHTYAHFTRDAIQLMKAVDPTIKVGVVGTWLETDFPQRMSVTNPRTGQSVNGWSAVLLSTLNNLGVVPDFYDIHYYPQNPGREDDAGLLLSPREWQEIMTRARQLLRDYFGAAGNTIPIFITENNSVAYNPGKQTTSMVNALYAVDSLFQALLNGAEAFLWWDMHNSTETSNNNSPVLYGWRNWGDYGVVASGYPSGVGDPLNTPYPTYHAFVLMNRFAKPNDVLVSVQSSHPLLSVYAVRTPNQRVRLMVVNKARTTTLNGEIRIQGATPATRAQMTQYTMQLDTQRKAPITRTITVNGSIVRQAFPPLSISVIEL